MNNVLLILTHFSYRCIMNNIAAHYKMYTTFCLNCSDIAHKKTCIYIV